MTDRAGLHVERRGSAEPEAETFLLVHGFGATSYTWRHWWPMLERRGRVLLVDLKGFGAAAKPDDGRYGPLDQVALLDDLIRREDPAGLTLIGHSFGGTIALLTALGMSERGDARLRRLVVVAGAAYPQRLPPFVTLAHHPVLSTVALRLLGPDRVIRAALRAIVADRSTVGRAQVEAYASALRSREGLRAAMTAARQLVPDDVTTIIERYPGITVPALLVWGRQDRVVPLSIGTRLAEALPDAELHVVERCGHIPHEEHAERTAALLERFLDRT